MTYTQTRDANWKIPYTGGWCLKYVQDSFGTDHPYASAIDAWNANYGGGNHLGELPPVGRTVAVYLSLGNVPAGHVAISLDDGTVASSTQSGTHSQGFIHPNLQNLIDTYAKYNGGCTYLGWSEFVGTVRVVTPVTQGDTNVAIIQDADNWRNRANKSFQTIRGRDMGAGEFEPWIGQDFLHLVEALEDDSEADANVNFAKVGRTAQNDNWQGQITDLQAKLGTEQTKDAGLATNLADVNARLDAANKAIADKDAALATDETKIADLSTQLSSLKAQADKPEPKSPTGQVAPIPTQIQTSSKMSPSKQTFMDWFVSLFKVSK